MVSDVSARVHWCAMPGCSLATVTLIVRHAVLWGSTLRPQASCSGTPGRSALTTRLPRARLEGECVSYTRLHMLGRDGADGVVATHCDRARTGGGGAAMTTLDSDAKLHPPS